MPERLTPDEILTLYGVLNQAASADPDAPAEVAPHEMDVLMKGL
jgi:hypothetical protein